MCLLHRTSIFVCAYMSFPLVQLEHQEGSPDHGQNSIKIWYIYRLLCVWPSGICVFEFVKITCKNTRSQQAQHPHSFTSSSEDCTSTAVPFADTWQGRTLVLLYHAADMNQAGKTSFGLSGVGTGATTSSMVGVHEWTRSTWPHCRRHMI